MLLSLFFTLLVVVASVRPISWRKAGALSNNETFLEVGVGSSCHTSTSQGCHVCVGAHGTTLGVQHDCAWSKTWGSCHEATKKRKKSTSWAKTTAQCPTYKDLDKCSFRPKTNTWTGCWVFDVPDYDHIKIVVYKSELAENSLIAQGYQNGDKLKAREAGEAELWVLDFFDKIWNSILEDLDGAPQMIAHINTASPKGEKSDLFEALDAAFDVEIVLAISNKLCIDAADSNPGAANAYDEQAKSDPKKGSRSELWINTCWPGDGQNDVKAVMLHELVHVGHQVSGYVDSAKVGSDNICEEFRTVGLATEVVAPPLDNWYQNRWQNPPRTKYGTFPKPEDVESGKVEVVCALKCPHAWLKCD